MSSSAVSTIRNAAGFYERCCFTSILTVPRAYLFILYHVVQPEAPLAQRSQPSSISTYNYEGLSESLFSLPLLWFCIPFSLISLCISIGWAIRGFENEGFDTFYIFIPLMFWTFFSMLFTLCLSCIQYLPQLLMTFKNGQVGSLSVPSFALQAPLMVVWIVFLYGRYLESLSLLSLVVVSAKYVIWACHCGAVVWVSFQAWAANADVCRNGREEAGGIQAPAAVQPDARVDEETPLLERKAAQTRSMSPQTHTDS
jgi:hypothetical protein